MGERKLRWKLGLILMGGAMLSKSLIWFSVGGWGCVPSLLFDLRPNYGEGNEDDGPPSEGPCMLSAPNPAPGHCQPTPPPGTSGHTWTSLGQSLVGSLLIFPGFWHAQGFVCDFQESVSQFSVSSGGSMVGLVATSSKSAYAIPRSTAPRAPAPEDPFPACICNQG